MLKCANEACGRTGEDIGLCGNFALCPKVGVEVTPRDVVLHCDLCEITRCTSASRIMKGKPLQDGHSCLQEACQAVPVMATQIVAQPVSEPAVAKGAKKQAD